MPLLAVQFAHHAPGGVHLNPSRARRATQEVLTLRFKPDLADLETRQAQKLFWRVDPIQIAVADWPDIAHHMGMIIPQRIAARQPHLWMNTG